MNINCFLYNLPLYSLPLNAICPSTLTLLRFRFARTFIKVLFPAPELPIIANTSPLLAHPETLSKITFFDFSLDFTPRLDHLRTLLLNLSLGAKSAKNKNLGSLCVSGVSICCIIRFLRVTNREMITVP